MRNILDYFDNKNFFWQFSTILLTILHQSARPSIKLKNSTVIFVSFKSVVNYLSCNKKDKQTNCEHRRKLSNFNQFIVPKLYDRFENWMKIWTPGGLCIMPASKINFEKKKHWRRNAPFWSVTFLYTWYRLDLDC